VRFEQMHFVRAASTGALQMLSTLS